MSENVQIPSELFFDLVRVHLLGVDDEEVKMRVVEGLEDKLNALTKRELYTAYKTAPTDEEREKARQAYLDKVSLPRDFRE